MARRALVAVLAVLSLVLVARFARYESRLLAYPFQWEMREGLSLHHAILVAEGEPLYRVRDAPPIVVPPYGPVYPAVVAPLIKALGRSFLAPRLVSLASVVLLLILVALAIHSLTQQWVWSLVGIGMTLLKTSWWKWLVLCRPDALGTTLLFLGLYLHWRRPASRLALLLVVLLNLAAFFTKAYFAVGAGSVLLSLLFVQREGKRALWFGLGLTAALAAAVGAAMAWTHGLYYVFTFELLNYWLGGEVKYSVPDMVARTAELFGFYLPVWAVLGHAASRGRLDWRRCSVLATHLIVASPMVALLLLNKGGRTYYWYVLLPAAIVLFCDRLAAEVADRASRIALPALALTAVLMAPSLDHPEQLPSAELASRWLPLRERVLRARGPVMNDEATVILNIEAGKELFNEGLGYSRTARFLTERHGHRFVDLEERLRQGYYALIVNPEERELVELYYVATGSYQLPVEFGVPLRRFKVYEPRE